MCAESPSAIRTVNSRVRCGTVRLVDVGPGETVVVRTNFHPSWTAMDGDRPVPLIEKGGQLAFQTPRGGSYDVTLIYPKRTWLLWVALASVIAGVAVCLVVDGRRARARQQASA